MQVPLQVSLHGIAHSDALYKTLRERAQKLDRYYRHRMSCRVGLELGARHQRKGKQYNVRGELTVTRAHDEYLQVALREAFDAARRQLEDYARVQRGD